MYILFDDSTRNSLKPFTHTRPIADIRCGIMTMRERWEHFTQEQTSTLTEDYLQHVFPLSVGDDNIYINAAVFANEGLYNSIQSLTEGEQLIKDDLVIAYRPVGTQPNFGSINIHTAVIKNTSYDGAIISLHNIWDIFSLNGQIIKSDFALLTSDRKSQPIPEGVTVTGIENLFLEEGAVINAGCIINATTGPVYLGKKSELLEGVIIRGPVAICEQAVVKMGAKIYGDTTIGNSCKVGGENSNVVYFANSNKGHDGYLGNAVIGEWCNLGADTNSSNLKNNYDAIKIWDEHNNKSIQTGLTFCGLMMGDHSKCGINTMFNTGTVVGVSANIYGGNFPPKFIPSFAWGGSEGMTTYKLERAMETANRVLARRHKELSAAEIEMMQHVFNQTQKQRDLFANS